MADTYYYVGDPGMGAYVGRRLEDAGIERADSVGAADVVFTYCPYASALEDAYFDDDGLIKSAEPGTLLIDLSPASPTLARELAAVATVSDLHPVEAPLALADLLSADAFAFDNLICYVAGDPDDIEAARRYLELLSGTISVAGASGRGQLAKAVHTIESVSALVGAIESWALLASAGAGAPIAGAGGLVDAIGDTSDEQGCPVGYILADVASAMAAADDAELILPQLESAMRLLELMAVIGGAESGPAMLRLLYRNEEEGAAHGLDWSRAEHLFGMEEDAGHDHGFEGDFSGYSSN